MSNTAEKLTYLNDTKQLLKENINSLGGNLTTEPFRQYASVLEGIYERIPKVSGIGTNLSLSPTMAGKIKLNEIDGDTLQDGTPTPDTPVEIQSVTGLQNVNVCGKNLLDLSKCINGYINASGGIGESNYDLLSDYIKVESGKNYTISINTQFYNIGYAFYDSSKIYITRYNTNRNITTLTITIPSGTSYIRVWFNLSGTTALTPTNILQYEPMIEQGSATTYEPYKGNTYEVNLGKNLCKEVIIQNAETIRLNANNKYLKQTFSISLIPTITISQMSVVAFADNKNLGRVGYIDLTNNTKSSATITLTDSVYKTILNAAAVNFNLYKRNAGIDTTSTIKEPQIENGSVTSYSPYFTPIELNKIGDYQDSIKKSTGKNLLNNGEVYSYTIQTSSKILFPTTDRYAYLVPVKPNTTYTFSRSAVDTASLNYIALLDSFTNGVNNPYTTAYNIGSNLTYTVTTENTTNYIMVLFGSGTSVDMQLEQNSQATSYEPYGKVWYVEKQTGKVVLDGNTNFLSISVSTSNGNSDMAYIYTTLLDNISTGSNGICDKLIKSVTELTINTNSNSEMFSLSNSYAHLRLYIQKSRLSEVSINGFKNWVSTNNIEIKYVLATPTTTEITNTTLIQELEALYTAKSKDGTTNISITSEDLPMIISASALKGED